MPPYAPGRLSGFTARRGFGHWLLIPVLVIAFCARHPSQAVDGRLYRDPLGPAVSHHRSHGVGTRKAAFGASLDWPNHWLQSLSNSMGKELSGDSRNPGALYVVPIVVTHTFMRMHVWMDVPRMCCLRINTWHVRKHASCTHMHKKTVISTCHPGTQSIYMPARTYVEGAYE
jgi:hypothetical protein